MEFGQVGASQLDKIDFTLPADDPRSWVSLERAKRHRPITVEPRIAIGCPIWGSKAWVGQVYPVGTNARDFLYHYSRQFTAVELNTTHYRIPDTDTIKRWRESTPEGFTFHPKFPQEISHHSPISGHEGAIHAFVNAVMGLENRLGLSFVQLPPAFGPNDLGDLKKFLALLPSDFRVAFEFRNSNLFIEHNLIQPFFETLEKAHAATVITDVAGRRDVLHTSLPTSRVLVRFIGNDLHPTDYTRVAQWVARLHTWLRLGIEEVAFFIHQPHDPNSPELISLFIDQLNKECELQLPTWKPANQGEQLGLF